ncbi:MAG: DMT family transporter, partial [Planctomycetota bacterium]|nr:DMT family transporter [Planctomycetota bacterium]
MSKKVGICAVITTSLMWAVESVLAKKSYESADFVQTLTVRTSTTVFFALISAIILNKGRIGIEKRSIPKIAYIALAGTVVSDLLYFYALMSIPVVNAALIAHTQPVFIALLGYFFLKEDKLTKFDYGGIIVLISAGLMVTTKTFENLCAFRFGTLGDLLMLLATFLWATAAMVAKKHLKNIPPSTLTFYRFLFSSFALIPY